MYKPRHKRHSLPTCGPYLATSDISTNNKVNTWNNGQCSEKRLVSTSFGQIWQTDKAVHTTTSSSEWKQARLGGRNGPSGGSIAQLTIIIEAFGEGLMGNALFKKWRQREMDRGLCGERDHCYKKASSRRRDSDYTRAERYDYCWKRLGDNQKARNNVSRHVEFYRRQSERSCKFRRWAGWGRQGRWWKTYRAWQAEWRWWTWMGDGHNLENRTAPHTEFSADADEAWRIDATGMEGHSKPVLWERYEVWDRRIDGSGGCQAPNRLYCSQNTPDEIWTAYADPRYRARTMANASSDFSTRK